MNEDSNWSDNSGYTNIKLYPSGSYKSFIPLIDTDWMLSGQMVVLQAEMLVTFHKNESIQSCYLKEPVILLAFGIPVRVMSKKILEFYEDGNIQVLTLAHQKNGFFHLNKGWSYRGKTYNPDVTLNFSPQGDIISKF